MKTLWTSIAASLIAASTAMASGTNSTSHVGQNSTTPLSGIYEENPSASQRQLQQQYQQQIQQQQQLQQERARAEQLRQQQLQDEYQQQLQHRTGPAGRAD